jgi:hypothetical protein
MLGERLMAGISKPLRKLLLELPAFRTPAVGFDAGADDVGSIADRLGRVAAVRAELEGYEETLKAIVRENGETAIEGRLFRATLSTYEQDRLDTKAIRDAMKPAWLKKHTITQTITKVSVKARTGIGLDQPA